MQIENILKSLGIENQNSGAAIGSKWLSSGEKTITSYSPVDGEKIGSVTSASNKDYEACILASQEAFNDWRMLPAPQRGEMVRQFGEALRSKKEALGSLVSYEMGKSFQEGLGEVQEMIDICDFAVGLSRQLHGLTMHSERPMHWSFRMHG